MTYNIKDMNACFIYNLVENKKWHIISKIWMLVLLKIKN